MSSSPEPSEDLLAYYGSGGERDRLTTGSGRLEFARTAEILGRWLPASATVADVGGGDGRYAEWLVECGHHVELVDPVPLHVELARRRAGDPAAFIVHQGDARALPLLDESVDVVLLLGPLYHLGERQDRLQALSEAVRVCRPEGMVVAAAISRYAPVLDVMRRGRLDDVVLANVERETSTGRRVPVKRRASPFPDAYFHLPEELRGELVEAGLEAVDVVGVQGPGWLLGEEHEAWADAPTIERLAQLARCVEQEPAGTVLSAHLLAAGRTPLR